MILEFLPQAFTVAKVPHNGEIPEGIFVFTARTDAEYSLVCPTSDVPRNTLVREDGWRAFRIAGTLEFSLVGILAGISSVLAKAEIGIFAVSTFDTDYILFKEERGAAVRAVLREAGYEIRELSL